jgi:sulfur carrier protein ThiS
MSMGVHDRTIGDWNLATRSEFFHRLEEDSVSDVVVDTWLYGELSNYSDEANRTSYANPQVHLSEGSTVRDLLAHLNLPTEKRGITFINGQLSAMPGLQPDLEHVLCNGDRVAFFDPRSMWPFQYRHGVPMIGEMSNAMQASQDSGLHHAYKT